MATNKIKWEEHYDDLLFDFIQFRSEHPNGNLSDSIKEFKKYMTKEEQPFQWSRELVEELVWENFGAANTRYLVDDFIKSKASKTNSITSAHVDSEKAKEFSAGETYTSQPKTDTKVRIPLALSKDVSDFIQRTFNLADDNWYWSEFFFKKVGDSLYELWSANQLPKYLKDLIKPKIYTEEQLTQARIDAFNAGRDRIGGFWNEQIKNWKYQSFQDYINPPIQKSQTIENRNNNFNTQNDKV